MAITTVIGGDSIKAVLPTFGLTTAYKTVTDWITVENATRFDIGSDDVAIGIVIKVSFDGGTTFSGDIALDAGFGVYPIAINRGQTLTLDVKSASGTPNLGGVAYTGA